MTCDIVDEKPHLATREGLKSTRGGLERTDNELSPVKFSVEMAYCARVRSKEVR